MRKFVYALVVFAGLVGMTHAELVHPGALSTQADLDRMAAKVAAGAQPWKGSWDILVGNEGWYMGGPYAVDTVYVDSATHWSNYMVLANDAHRAYQAALRYHGTGDTNYAEHAVAIMNAWASTHTGWEGNSNVFLRQGLYGYAFACAGELMRNYEGWDPADFAAFQQYMRDQYYDTGTFYTGCSGWLQRTDTHYWANWTLANMCSMLAIGVLCDEQAIIDEALDHFYNALHTGCIEEAVYYVHPNGLGQWQESGRDQGHAQMGPQLIGTFCEIAWNQGYDLYGYMDNRVLAGVEYVSKYNMSHAVPYAAYANSDYGVWPNVYRFVFKGVAGWPSGGGRPGWDLIYNHYVNRMGMAAPYTAKYAEATRPEGGGRNYGSNSGGFDGLGFTTLTHSRDPIASGAVPGALRPVVQGRQITLSWTGSAYAESYNVKRSTTSGGPYTTLATVDGDSLFYVDPGLTVDTTYYYVVSANNPGGESADSAEAAATADAQLFGTVIGTEYSSGWHGATREILFDGSLDNFIEIGGSGGGWAGLDLGSGVSAVITGVRYCPRTGRINDMVGGKFQASSTADFSSDVVDLFTITNAPTEGELTFQAVNSGSAYRYVRYIQPNNGEWNIAAEVQFLGTAAGQSAPAVPVVSAALVNGAQINLSLDSLSGIPGSAGYRIKRSTTSGGPYLVYGDINPGYGDTTVFSDVETETNTTYYYVVSAYNQLGESADTAELSFSALSTAPQLMTYLKMSGNVDDSSDNNFLSGTVGSPEFSGGGYIGSSIDLDGVDDYVTLNGRVADSDDITVAAWVNWDGGGAWQRIFDFGAGTESYMHLTPSSGDGTMRFAIKNGSEQIVDTSALPTGTWTHVAVTLGGDTTTIYVNGSSVASSSSITNNPSDFDHWSTCIGKSQFADPLFNGRIDEFRVYNYALSAGDVAALAAEASDMTPPAAPAGLVATNGAGTVDLDWADNGETDFASYTVYRSTTSGSGYSEIATGLTASSYTDSAVANEVTYFYVVKAVDTSGGESADSAEASAMPQGMALVRLELEGNTLDSSGNSHDATATGSPAYVAGWTGQAIDLDGSDDYLTIPSGVVSDVENLTIAAWVNWDGGNDWQRIFDFGDSTGRYMYLSPKAGSGKLRVAINNGKGEQIAEASVLETGTWVHLAVTFSGWTTTLYVNGVAVASNGASLNPTGFDFTPLNNYIGKSQFGADPLFNGRIDDFRIYSYALSNTAIADLAVGAPADTRAPVAPAELVATANDGIVDLDWADNIEIDLASYTVYRSTTSGSGYTGVASGLTNSAYADTAVTNDVTYYYVVTATDTLTNESPFSVETSASPSDLELYLKFDETDGTTAIDSSFRGNNATLVNSPAFSGGWIGNALVLDAASSQHATLPSGIVSELNDFTVSTWIKVDAFETWQRIFDFGTGTDNYMFLTAQGPAGAGRFRFGILNSGDEQSVDSTVALTTNAWTHVALTRSGDTVSIYIDGSLAGSGTITINPSDLGTTTQNYLGKSQWADPYLDAALDDFRIYNRALSAGEIALFQPQLDAPTGLNTTPGESQVQLTWSAVANAASYKVMRSLTSGGPYSTLQDNVAATSYTDNDVSSSTTYYYIVSAVDTASNESANSAESSATTLADTTPPAVPSGLRAIPGDGRVTLDWADNSESDFDSYAVYRSTTSGSGYVSIDSSLTNSAYTDISVTNGVTYYYVVTASDITTNESVYSSEVSAVPVAASFIAWWRFEEGTNNAEVPGTSENSAYQVGTPDMSGNGNHLCDYWNDGRGISYSTNVPSVAGVSNTLSGLSDDAYPAMYTWSDESSPSGIDLESAVLGAWTIEAYVNASAIAGSNRGIVGRDGIRTGGDAASPLYFNIQANGTLRCTYYDQAETIHDAQSVVALTTDRWYYVAATCDGTTLKLWLADVTAGETNATEVASVDVSGSADPDFGPWPDGGNDSWSVFRQYWNHGHVDRFMGNIDEVRICNSALDINAAGLLKLGSASVTPPAAPTGLTATPADGSVALDWNDNAEGDLDGYTVYRSTTSGSGHVSIAPGLTNSAYLDSSVVNGTKYYYIVTADNAGGSSTNSAEVSAQPVSAVPATLLCNLGDGQFEFSWPVDHTGWRLQTSTNLIGANWQDVSGAETTNVFSIAPTNSSTFFRLIHP